MILIIACGLIGGLSIEAVYWWSKRESLGDGLPEYAKKYAYWAATFGMIFFSGFLVWLYQISGFDLKPIVAFNIGASTPSIISAFSKIIPPTVKIDPIKIE